MHSDHEVLRKQWQKWIHKGTEKRRWLENGANARGIPRSPREPIGSLIQTVHEGEKADSSGNETQVGDGGADDDGRWIHIGKEHVVCQSRDRRSGGNLNQRNGTVRHVDHVTVSIEFCGSWKGKAQTGSRTKCGGKCEVENGKGEEVGWNAGRVD